MRKIPNYLDDQQQILFWEFDEFILLSLAFGIGIMLHYLGTFIVIGLLAGRFYRRMKDRRANGFLIHALYWITGMRSVEKYPTSRPLPFIKRFF
ncbi:type IV conjugative transfer system protein TraL [Methylomonas sp. AM2-LC]|uniref:type IV conjugative transfer system protein TraL n=1 Tax=Methylomonas sp. AM2-LC TaxID=3153301 RepID=UPI003263D2C8